MAEYQLTVTDETVVRTADRATIPNAPGNRDWDEYQVWLADGGVPDPYVPPVVETLPTEAQALAFDHENRILALEGQPPITMEDFAAKMTAK